MTYEVPKKRVSYANQVAKTMANNICYYTGTDQEGRTAWYFILLEQGKKERFAKEYTGEVDLTHYGRILASGFGETPPKEVLELMKEQYDFVLA